MILFLLLIALVVVLLGGGGASVVGVGGADVDAQAAGGVAQLKPAIAAARRHVQEGDDLLRGKNPAGAAKSFQLAAKELRPLLQSSADNNNNADAGAGADTGGDSSSSSEAARAWKVARETCAQALYKLATCELIVGRGPAAMEALGDALAVHPDFSRARLRRAKEFVAAGDAAGAAGDVEYLLAHHGPGSLPAGAEPSEVKKAERLLEDARKIEDSATRLQRALDQAQRHQAALVDARRARDADVESAEEAGDGSAAAIASKYSEMIVGSANHCEKAWADVLEIAKTSLEARLARLECALEPTLVRGAGLTEATVQQQLKLVVDDAMTIVKAGGNGPAVVSALVARARAFYGLGEMDAAMQHVKKALKHDPDHKVGKGAFRAFKRTTKLKDATDQATSSRKWEEGLEAATELEEAAWDAGNAQWLDSVLHRRRCESVANIHASKMPKKDRLDICTRAIEFGDANNDGDLHVTALCWRAEIHMSSHGDTVPANWDAAIGDASHAQNKAGNNGGLRQRAGKALQDAQQGKKIAERVDYYKVLGVPRGSTTQQIKKAYRKLARDLHPDKMDESLSAEEKSAHEKRYMDVAHAYEILGDDDLRRRWEAGEEVDTHAQREGQQQQGHGFPGGFPFGGFGGNGGFEFNFRQG